MRIFKEDLSSLAQLRDSANPTEINTSKTACATEKQPLLESESW